MAKAILPLLDVEDSALKRNYLKMVVKTGGCWSWLGSRNKAGYTYVCASHSNMFLGHRVSYAIHHNVDPGDLDVLHRCDNPICTNPDHLFLGTDKDNSDDKIAKGRAVYAPVVYGEANYMSVLLEEQVRYIKIALSLFMTNTELGKLFGVSHATISEIKRGNTWRGVLIEEE